MLSNAFIEPGDYVVTESPTFIGAIQVFQKAGARVLTLPAGDGFSLSSLEYSFPAMPFTANRKGIENFVFVMYQFMKKPFWKESRECPNPSNK